MKWRHPELGDIEQMSAENQVWKTWKHFHEPTERWAGLVGMKEGALLSLARANGCRSRAGVRLLTRSPRLAPSCTRCLRDHHHRWWRELYGAALLADDTVYGPSRSDGHRHVFLDARGIWVVVDLEATRQVLTVFRPHPLGSGVQYTEDADYHEHGLRRFKKETGMAAGDLSARLARTIHRPADVWHLAAAIGEAMEAGGGVDAGLLDGASGRLRAAPAEWVAQVRPDPEVVLSALEEALGDGADVEDAMDFAASFEEVLQVMQALGDSAEAERLLAAALDLVGWAPPAWLALEPLARARRDELVGAARGWWEGVVEVCEALEVSEAPVAAPALPTPVAARMFAPTWWERWQDTARDLRDRWVELAVPATAQWQLGAAQMTAGESEWALTPLQDLEAGAQLFVVDAEEPDGVNVTGDYEAGEPLWLLETPGQEARLVLVTGVPRARSLEDALAAVQRTEGGRVEVMPLKRPG